MKKIATILSDGAGYQNIYARKIANRYALDCHEERDIAPDTLRTLAECRAWLRASYALPIWELRIF